LQVEEEKMNQPFYTHKTFWTSTVGMVAAVAALWAVLDPGHAIKIGVIAAGVSSFLGNLGSIFARQGGVEAAKDVAAGVPPETKA
jgi:hypothetical protein